MPSTTKATLAGLLGYSIFGFSFLFSKTALSLTTPFVLLSVRFVTAFLVLNLLLLAGKQTIRLKGKPVGRLLLMGLVQPVIYFICETYGIALTTSSFAGVMLGLVPIVGLLLGVLFLKESCTVFQGVCAALSVLGVVMTTTGGFGTFSLPGFCLLLGSVFATSFFTILSRSISEIFSPFERTYVMFAMSSVTFTGIALVEIGGDLTLWTVPLTTPTFWVSALYLAILSSVCAFLLINSAINHLSAGRTLILANFSTVVSVLAGIFIMGDTFSLTQLAGIAIIIFSVFGVSFRKPS